MLVAPTVVPPITPWSRSIRVKGQHTGASVTVFADDQRVGAAMAGSPDVFVPLDPGVEIKTGQKMSAVQEVGGETSGPTAKTAAPTVLKAPTPAMLGKIFSRAPLSGCATCLWLEGIVPGADVTVMIAPHPPIKVVAEWTAVHVDVPMLSAGDVVIVTQSRGAVGGLPVSLPPALAQPEGIAFAAPALTEPLVACDRSLELFDVRPGARITIDHNGDVSTFCFGSLRGTFWLGRRLELGDSVTTRQDFPQCQLSSSGDHPYTVSAQVPAAPWFPYPICAGDRDVDVEGLRPGAVVEFLIGEGTGTTVTGEVGEPPHRFNLPPIGNLTRLGVRQSLCPAGPWSPTTWTTLVAVGSVDDPKLDEPLYDCGAAVGVMSLSAGTRVHVVSDFWGGSIGDIVSVGDAFTDVPLQFPLVVSDTLALELVRCGQLQTVASGSHVNPAPDQLLAPLIFEPLDDAGGAITVGRLVPGAFCDIERVDTPVQNEGVLVTSQAVTRSEASVGVPPLPPGLLIRARQRLCGLRSRPSIVVKTGDRAPDYEPWSADRIVALTGTRGTAMRPPRYDTTTIGLTGTDLGIPVVHNGVLYLFFGDCDPNPLMKADADPIAWTTDPPERAGGPYLSFLIGDGGTFHRLHVDGLPELGNFEVPTGAFSYDGRLYVFVAREKEPKDPPGERMNTSHLAVTKQPGAVNDNLDLLYDVASTLPKNPPPPAGRWLVHVSPTVVRCKDWPGLPAASADGLVMFGSELYHASNLFLAFCPLGHTSVSVPLGPGGPWTHDDDLVVPHPSTWLYFVAGQPATAYYPANWRPTSALPPGGPTPLIPPGATFGEVSVTWHPRLRRWLAVYPDPDGIVVRSARAPWGPWDSTPPRVIFNGLDAVFQATADNLQPGHQFVGLNHDWENRKTGVYAPYVVPLWTRFDRSIRVATIYYTLSTEHPPYNVQLMKARLQFR